MSGCGFDPVYAAATLYGHAYCTPPNQTRIRQPIMAINDAARSQHEWAQSIRGEFLEIPGLRLTSDQIQRLWGLHRDTCAVVLEDLLHRHFLELTPDGHYVRAGSSAGARQVTPQGGTLHGEAPVSAR
jgi:hypothetical protein